MSDGHELFTVHWKSSLAQKKAVILIFHGMAEHIFRYHSFAKTLVETGFDVYGHDQRGHGQTAKRNGIYGFFAETGGFDRVVQDGYERLLQIKKEHPKSKIIIFGHSMGSFIVRRFIQLYSTKVDGVILSGTGGNPKWLGNLGMVIAKGEIKRKGKKTKSPLLDKLLFGSFNKKFSPNRTECDWLSSDEIQVDQYISDELCGGICTTQFYYDLFSGIKHLYKNKEIKKIRKDLPIFLISGREDPVGNFGKGVVEAARSYIENGKENVTVKLYDNARHEIINETKKETVYRDIQNWMKKNNLCR